jgi:poly-gamma-glutamate synthesis protein (capsule biosynthesis protein)
MVRSPAGTIGIVAIGKYYGREKTASVVGAGTVALSEASIIRGATLARSAGADWIVGFVHWGGNYQDVGPEQEDFAEDFAEAGYDLVVGAHPHISQGIEFVDGMPVVYSMGNFAFGAPGRFNPDRPGTGLIVKASFGAEGLGALTVRCIDTDNEVVAYQARACDPAVATATLTGLNPAMVVDAGVGTLAIP